MMIRSFFILVISFFLGHSLVAQDSYWGGTVGVSYSFGTNVNRIGVLLSGYYNYKFTQVNSTIRVYYNHHTLGLGQSNPELQLGLGTQFGFIGRDTVINDFVGITENNMPYENSIGYAYMHYIDKQKTTQGTGLLAFNFNRVSIISENDLFAGGLGNRDRYRTGGVYVGYQYQDTKIGLNVTLWTGDYTGGRNIRDSDYPSRFGYIADNKSHYGNYSAGLFSVQVKRLLAYRQVVRGNLGVDSEHVRNILQNKLMHDLPFLPKKWMQTEQLHVPMLTKEGEQYLYLSDQEVKPTSFYLNFAMNTGWFY